MLKSPVFDINFMERRRLWKPKLEWVSVDCVDVAGQEKTGDLPSCMCMYIDVSMYVEICVCVYVRMHICIHTYIYVCM